MVRQRYFSIAFLCEKFGFLWGIWADFVEFSSGDRESERPKELQKPQEIARNLGAFLHGRPQNFFGFV